MPSTQPQGLGHSPFGAPQGMPKHAGTNPSMGPSLGVPTGFGSQQSGQSGQDMGFPQGQFPSPFLDDDKGGFGTVGSGNQNGLPPFSEFSGESKMNMPPPPAQNGFGAQGFGQSGFGSSGMSSPGIGPVKPAEKKGFFKK
jgi:hypothetical protein